MMVNIVSDAWTGRAGRILLVAGLMVLLAVAGIELTRLSDRIASVWLANGAVLAVMLRSDRREWPALALVALAANVAANLLVATHPRTVHSRGTVLLRLIIHRDDAFDHLRPRH